MTVLYKLIAVLILSVPSFFLSGKVIPYLSGRIEKELTELGEEFSPLKNPKKASVIFQIILIFLYVITAINSGDNLGFTDIIRFISIILLIYILSVISRLDMTYCIIPNGTNLIILIGSAIVSLAIPLLWGLQDGIFDTVVNCLIGFAVGGLSLFVINLISRLVFKRDGVGGGDMKMMFGIGLLLGLKLTIFALLLSFILGAIIGVLLRVFSRSEDEMVEIPFGPYLALGSVTAALFGDSLIKW